MLGRTLTTDSEGRHSWAKSANFLMSPATDTARRPRRTEALADRDGFEHPPGRLGDLVDTLLERVGVLPGRGSVSAHLPDELQRGRPDLFLRGRFLGSTKGLDASAHGSTIAADGPFDHAL